MTVQLPKLKRKIQCTKIKEYNVNEQRDTMDNLEGLPPNTCLVKKRGLWAEAAMKFW